MVYKKHSLRVMPPTTRKLARLIGDIESVERRLKNLLREIDTIERRDNAEQKRLATLGASVRPATSG